MQIVDQEQAVEILQQQQRQLKALAEYMENLLKLERAKTNFLLTTLRAVSERTCECHAPQMAKTVLNVLEEQEHREKNIQNVSISAKNQNGQSHEGDSEGSGNDPI